MYKRVRGNIGSVIEIIHVELEIRVVQIAIMLTEVQKQSYLSQYTFANTTESVIMGVDKVKRGVSCSHYCVSSEHRPIRFDAYVIDYHKNGCGD